MEAKVSKKASLKKETLQLKALSPGLKVKTSVKAGAETTTQQVEKKTT